MAPVVTRRTIFGAKVETTRGTDSVPTAAANAIVIYDLEIKPLDGADSMDRKPIVGHMSMETPISGLLQGKATFKTYLSGSSAAGTAPDWFVLARGAGFRETLVGATSARLRPASTDALMPCLSIYAWMDGHLYKLLGAAGNMKLMMEVGKMPTSEYEYTGIYSIPTLVTLPTASVAYTEHVAPPTFRGVGFTFTPSGGAAHTPVLRKLEYDAGCDVQLRPDANNTSGNISAIIVDRSPTMSFTVEEPDSYTPAAGQNWWSNFTGDVAGAVSIGPLGSVAGRILNLDFPNVGLAGGLEPSTENGMLVLNVKATPATAAIAVGDDEFDLIYT